METIGRLLTLTHLQLFVTLAEELHFGRAATRLHISTSTLSKRVSELEQDLGVQLFERSTRQVQLTPAGTALVAHANRTLAEVVSLREAAADAAAGESGVLTTAYAPGTEPFMTALAKEVRRRHPALELRPAQHGVSIDVAKAVLAHEATFGLTHGIAVPGLDSVVLAQLPTEYVIMPSDHRLADLDEVGLEDLGGETLIGVHPTVWPRADYADWWCSLGESASVTLRYENATSVTEIMELVACGYGLVLGTSLLANSNMRPDLTVRRLAESLEHVQVETWLVWRADNGAPPVAAVVKAAHAVQQTFAQG